MKRRREIHTGRRQARHLAHETARRRKRKVIVLIERLKGQLIPSPRMVLKVKARYAMLEAIAEERKAEAARREIQAAVTGVAVRHMRDAA